MDSNTTIQAAQGINSTNKSQVGAALKIQLYCNRIKMQPDVDLSGISSLATYQSQINLKLKTAQNHASNYLNNIQPNIIKNISSIDNYYSLHNAIATSLPPGTSKEDWIESLTALRDQSVAYQKDASDVLNTLQTFHSNLTSDAAEFKAFVNKLHTEVGGVEDILKSDRAELDKMQSKIDGAISGIIFSGLAIVGGIFMVAIGGIGDFVTAGTTTPLVVAGVAVIFVGAGSEVASAIILDKLNNEKAKIFSRDSLLKAEIKLSNAISADYTLLGKQLEDAVDAATAMENAWAFLSNDLNALISDLDKGIINDGILQKIFLKAANSEIEIVLSDINTIKSQMTGVKVIPVNENETVGQAILNAAKKAA